MKELILVPSTTQSDTLAVPTQVRHFGNWLKALYVSYSLWGVIPVKQILENQVKSNPFRPAM